VRLFNQDVDFRMLLLGVVEFLLLVAALQLGTIAWFGRDRFARRVLVIGAGEKWSDLRNIRVRQDLRGFEVVGFMPTDEDTRRVPPEWQLDISHEMLRAFVSANDMDEVVVAVDDRRRGLAEAFHGRKLSLRIRG
jgi:hypothetical protein